MKCPLGSDDFTGGSQNPTHDRLIHAFAVKPTPHRRPAAPLVFGRASRGQQRLGLSAHGLRSAAGCTINGIQDDTLTHSNECIVHARPADEWVPVEHRPQMGGALEFLRESEPDRPQHCQSRESNDLQQNCHSAQCAPSLTCSSHASLKPIGDSGRNRDQGIDAGVVDAHDDNEREIQPFVPRLTSHDRPEDTEGGVNSEQCYCGRRRRRHPISSRLYSRRFSGRICFNIAGCSSSDYKYRTEAIFQIG